MKEEVTAKVELKVIPLTSWPVPGETLPELNLSVNSLTIQGKCLCCRSIFNFVSFLFILHNFFQPRALSYAIFSSYVISCFWPPPPQCRKLCSNLFSRVDQISNIFICLFHTRYMLTLQRCCLTG